MTIHDVEGELREVLARRAASLEIDAPELDTVLGGMPRHQRHYALLAAAVLAAALMGTAVWIGSERRAAEPTMTSHATTPTAPETPPAIVDSGSNVVRDENGYPIGVDGAIPESMNPVYLESSAGPIEAYEVRSDSGELEGYMVSTVGFVATRIAEDPSKLGQLVDSERAVICSAYSGLDDETLRELTGFDDVYGGEQLDRDDLLPEYC